MAIKYLRGVAANTDKQLIKFRPDGFEFPKGLKKDVTAGFSAFDVLIVGGGGNGGGNLPPSYPIAGNYGGGGGGAGGFRVLTANTFSEIDVTNPSFVNFSSPTQEIASIPVIVGAAAGSSCIGSPTTCICSSAGGRGGQEGPATIQASPGGSGGGGHRSGPAPTRPGGLGIAGQGCNGGNGGPTSGCGGSASADNSAVGGITNSFIGTPVSFSNGGCNSGGASATANRGNAGAGRNAQAGNGGSGGSGIVAIRYCNPGAPTTPLATGGSTICCTGGCIIHIFCSSSFFNVNTSTNIN